MLADRMARIAREETRVRYALDEQAARNFLGLRLTGSAIGPHTPIAPGVVMGDTGEQMLRAVHEEHDPIALLQLGDYLEDTTGNAAQGQLFVNGQLTLASALAHLRRAMDGPGGVVDRYAGMHEPVSGNIGDLLAAPLNTVINRTRPGARQRGIYIPGISVGAGARLGDRLLAMTGRRSLVEAADRLNRGVPSGIAEAYRSVQGLRQSESPAIEPLLRLLALITSSSVGD